MLQPANLRSPGPSKPPALGTGPPGEIDTNGAGTSSITGFLSVVSYVCGGGRLVVLIVTGRMGGRVMAVASPSTRWSILLTVCGFIGIFGRAKTCDGRGLKNEVSTTGGSSRGLFGGSVAE